MSEKKAVKLTERVEVVGAEKAKYYQAGKSYMVHPETAKRLVKKGEAEYAKKIIK